MAGSELGWRGDFLVLRKYEGVGPANANGRSSLAPVETLAEEPRHMS